MKLKQIKVSNLQQKKIFSRKHPKVSAAAFPAPLSYAHWPAEAYEVLLLLPPSASVSSVCNVVFGIKTPMASPQGRQSQSRLKAARATPLGPCGGGSVASAAESERVVMFERECH